VVGLGALGAMTLGPSLFGHPKKAATKTAVKAKPDATPADEPAGKKFDWMTTGPQPTVARDPFSVTVPLRLAGGRTAPAPSRSTAPAPAWDFPSVAPWGSTPGTTPGGAPALTANSKPAKTPAVPVLTGTLLGDPPLALISFGGQRVIVQRGDWIGDQYLVVSIDSGQCVLTNGSEQIALTLGGAK